MNTYTIGTTSKGSRVWLQGLTRYGWDGGDFYTTEYTSSAIVLTKVPTKQKGARKVTAAKDGIIDLCSNKVTEWAQEATQVAVVYTEQAIIITREK